jgi:hypothetical protein
MHADDIVPGMRVRYPRTGTSGTVQRIESIRGTEFAELDSTHLMYRTDQLIPAGLPETVRQAVIEDAKKTIAEEREYAAGSGLQEALKNIDQSCEGGG